jgi:periplasmic protein TonB
VKVDEPAAPSVGAPPAGASPWLDSLAHCLIQVGARHTPSSLSRRLEEEWLADLAGQRGGLARLRFALGCCWASRVIAYELAATVRTAASATGPKSVTLDAQPHPSRLSPRAAVLLLILCLHGLAIYALATGLARQVMDEISPTIKVAFLSQPNITQPPPLTSRANFVHPTVENVAPDLAVDSPADPDAIRDPTQPPPERPLSPPPAKPASRILGGPAQGFPNTEDYYPAASKRIGERGVVTVQVCVEPTGRLAGDPAIAQSSGSARLDEGALRLARAGSGHYRATTEDGRPVSSCFAYRIRFELRN